IDAVEQATAFLTRSRSSRIQRPHIPGPVRPRGATTMPTEPDTKVHAELRENCGKGFARRARAAGKIPAVIYGHGTDPVHITLPAHDTAMALKHANALLTIELGKDSQLAIAKDIQRDAVKRIIEHIDLIIVKKGEKITVDVPLHIVGESYPGTIHIQDHSTLQVIVEATHIPESLEANIEGFEEGHNLTAGDIELPKGVELVTDAEAIV